MQCSFDFTACTPADRPATARSGGYTSALDGLVLKGMLIQNALSECVRLRRESTELNMYLSSQGRRCIARHRSMASYCVFVSNNNQRGAVQPSRHTSARCRRPMRYIPGREKAVSHALHPPPRSPPQHVDALRVVLAQCDNHSQPNTTL